MNIDKLSLEEKLGQMLMIGLDVYEINEEIIELIEKYKVGGVVLYRKNYTSLETMNDVINRLKRINRGNKIPLFIAIDQENGRVNRFPKEILGIYSPYKQSKTDNINIINSANELTTYLLKSLGVNMNFAPVLDINRDYNNKIVSSRSYGKNKEDVIKYALKFMKTMQENNIISVVKHFPGHGATDRDSRFGMPWLDDYNLLQNEDMVPFKEAIKNNCDAVMTGHLRIKGYGIKPVTYNKKIIEECLIKNYNYNGLVITDDLRMGIMRLFSLKSRIIKCVEAGNDIIVIKYKKGDIKRVYKDLYKRVNNCEIDIDKIENAYKKIVKMKKKYEINDREIKAKLDISLINKKIKSINKAIEKGVGL